MEANRIFTLDSSSDLFFTPDNRVQLSLACKFGQISSLNAHKGYF